MNAAEREVFEKVIRSLREHPENWTRDGHNVTHKSKKVYVWLANGYFSLSINAYFVPGSDTIVGRQHRLWGWLVPWRRQLMAAAMSIPSQQDMAFEANVSTALDALAA